MRESDAAAIRGYLAAWLRPDPNCSAGAYPVCSVYLDSADNVLYEQTNQGIRNRYKLRARIYDNDPAKPAFLEIKGREGNAIKKQRARVDRRIAAAVLSGQPASISESTYLGTNQSDWTAFHEFCRLRDRISAVGSTYVGYQREAYVSPMHTEWRATFDRQLQTCPYASGQPIGIPQDWVSAAESDLVVFELKYSNDFPSWMEDLVRTFDLVAGPFPKYVTCRDRILSSPSMSDGQSEMAGWQV